MSQFRAYCEAPVINKKARGFFDFRMRSPDYDNGEYLSQGILHHAGRSSVASLEQLIHSELHELCPECADPNGEHSWANRVKFLRSKWSIRHTTTQLDIKTAIKIARTCFNSHDVGDVALLLLSFKSRGLRDPATEGTLLKFPR
jgi:hypothetical protein